MPENKANSTNVLDQKAPDSCEQTRVPDQGRCKPQELHMRIIHNATLHVCKSMFGPILSENQRMLVLFEPVGTNTGLINQNVRLRDVEYRSRRAKAMSIEMIACCLVSVVGSSNPCCSKLRRT